MVLIYPEKLYGDLKQVEAEDKVYVTITINSGYEEDVEKSVRVGTVRVGQ